MSVTTVNIAPAYSNVRVLRPFENFEGVLQGQDPEKAHIICPGGLDQFAGKPGYAPNLNAAAPVLLGSKVMLWFPRILNGYGAATPNYTYRLIWRLRTFAEAAADAERQLSGHLGLRREGRPQAGETGDAARRYIIPAAYQTIQFVANKTGYDEGVAEVGTPPGQLTNPIVNGVDNVDVPFTTAEFKTILPDGNNSDGYWTAPLAPSFSGTRLGNVRITTQGFYDDLVGDTEQNAGFLGGPSHDILMLPALGDELIVEVFRSQIQTPYGGGTPGVVNWDFTGLDAGLSTFLGNDNGAGPIPNSGIYLISGM